MPTYTPMYSRSPRVVEISGTAGQETKVKIWIWNEGGAESASPQYTLSAPIPSSIQTSCFYDISPYCREYISFSEYVETSADVAAQNNEWCYVHVKTYLNNVLQNDFYYACFDGYGYHTDEANPDLGDTKAHMTDGTYYVREGGRTGGVFYYDDQVVTWQAKWTGLTSGATTTVTLAYPYGYVPYIHPSYNGQGNKLEIIRNAVTVNTYYFIEECESRYTEVVCDFINKWGAWQQLIFFKRSKNKIDITNQQYNMYPSDWDYDTANNITKTFNTNMVQTIICNTGWVNEGYSEVMRQLLLSEKIMLDGLPVVLDTKGVDLKTHLSDKVINYELTFKQAYHTLNYLI